MTTIARPLRYFLWQRQLARVMWIACVGFWGTAASSIFVGALGPVFDNAVVWLFLTILFPPLVSAFLIISWLRQEIDAGRIVLTPLPLRDRSVGGWMDPMADPMDPRSPNHTHYIDRLHGSDY